MSDENAAPMNNDDGKVGEHEGGAPEGAPNGGAGAGGSEHLNLKVKSQDGNEVYFKVKKTTQFSKVMSAYCKKVGADLESVRFLFDGQRLRPDQTPADVSSSIHLDGQTHQSINHTKGVYAFLRVEWINRITDAFRQSNMNLLSLL